MNISNKPPCKCIVRLTTEYWYDSNGIHMKKSLRFLKRKCVGYNILYEDLSYSGAEDIFSSIININECQDGVYEVITCNEFSCWETPHIIEDYDYKLIPYEEIKKVDKSATICNNVEI